MRRNVPYALAFACCILLAADARACPSTTPEAAYDELTTAIEGGDWAAVADCIDPEVRPAVAAATLGASVPMVVQAEVLGRAEGLDVANGIAAYETILEAHDLPPIHRDRPSPAALLAMLEGKETNALLEATTRYLAEDLPVDPSSSYFTNLINVWGGVSGITVDGSGAKGKADHNRDVHFANDGSGWYLTAPPELLEQF